MKNALLVLAALTLCCCFTCLHSSPPRHCRCIGVVPCCVPRRFIRKIEVIPNSGNCRRTEVIITRKNNSTDCVSPNDPRLKGLLQSMSLRQRRAAVKAPAVQ
ncbi:C-X-C motif chemokine 13-like [Salarias fasciatus]|uniref:C-X-C motif chemokine 13-like n=1 Tax=Salarias fasciatus TaxID=181472 RepID=UPI0011766F7E|nr:C-X-C motif chemokine 13-like [Salarias fasciatus]XP_029961194.1 C-X-C motif chemokine 13-like [Salarias fasciatus]